jgi:alpha-1,6-mannosyltransferase
LCEAFRLLHARNPSEYHLIITGEGLQRASVERLHTETGAVTWLPYLNGHAELLRLYHAADMFVHPGVRETFGLVTLEAQACALPVVGFRGTAMDRIVCHEQSFWAGEHTPAALADAITKAFAHDLPAMGAAAREKVSAQFAWSRVFARQFEIYRDVIAAKERLI